MKEKLQKLIDVKSIITIMMTVCFIYLATGGVIDRESFMTVFVMVIMYYFNKDKKEKPKTAEEEEQKE